MSELTIDPPAEATSAYDTDGVVPLRGVQALPVVGLGASAGGITALRQFFQAVPADTGMAFVVVLHLPPEFDSRLDDLLRTVTTMGVVKVDQTERIQPNVIYVIPQGKALRSVDGYLQLTDLPTGRHRHVVVDLLFRTLSETHGPNATAVVLSGADSDGAIGIKRIKERGGLTIAQDPNEAEHSSMPRAAMATEMVDWVLPVAEIMPRIIDYHRQAEHIRLPPRQGPQQVPDTPPARGEADELALRDVLNFLHSRTGRDFTHYKRATILRRVGRRMQVNGVDDLVGYLRCLRTRPGETGALLQDLLISVTHFFRDPECYEVLENAIPRLFANKKSTDAVRVWVAACATGEEAYSIGILLMEHARRLESPPLVQVFATDLDGHAIGLAREGLYPLSIEADVPQDRLNRYFYKEHQSFRVRRELREIVLFAVHDLLKDSPFSRLDLISCRNLLIYLNRGAQNRVLDTFHFALQPGGQLFLGSSESVEGDSHLFDVLDEKHRLYTQRVALRSAMPLPDGPGTLALALDAQQTVAHLPVIVGGRAFAPPPLSARSSPVVEGSAVSWGELHFKLLEHLSPPSVLVDGRYEIVHLSPSAGQFMQHAGGEPSRNLLRVIHSSLRIELRAALYQASQSGTVVDVAPLALELGRDVMIVKMQVRPSGHVAPGLLLVVLEAMAPASEVEAAVQALPKRDEADPLAQRLDRELERLKTHLRDTVEQYETSAEELKASNEELQAMNEELRSATEELETNREELQSINEELVTVNHELKCKVDELGHSNSDLHNLMDATAIATVFLDRDLRITRYTPPAVSLFNLIPTDAGRPLSDLTSQLDYPSLGEDARRVLERLVPVEREVGQADGCWFLVRSLPYRTLDDRIAGVVLTFVDITERKRDQEALRLSEERFSAIVTEAAAGVVQTTLDGRITFANRFYIELMGYTEEELFGRRLLDLVHADDLALSSALFQRLVEQGDAFHLEKRCVRKDGSVIWLHNSVSYLSDGQGLPASALVLCTDISERKRAEDALRHSEERLRMVVENAVEYAIFSTDLQGRVTSWNAGAERLLGYSEAEILNLSGDILYIDEDRSQGVPAREACIALEKGRSADDRLHQRKDGSRFWASGVMMLMHDRFGDKVGFVKILRDQSEDRAAREALEKSQTDLLNALQAKEAGRMALEAADASKDRFLAVLSHELRNPLASVRSAAQVLQAVEVDEEARQRAAKIVQRQSLAMKFLLDDLLDISRLRLGRLVLHRRSVDLQSVMETALEATRPLILAAGHQLTVSLPALPVQIDADPVRLSQVLSNLIGNAAKYTPPAGRIEVQVAVDMETEQAAFHITDNGIGMNPDSIESMFEMFFQDSEGRRVGGGLGIGLALVRSIVELHGGRVTARSEGPGQGSCFSVTLPLSPRPFLASGPSEAAAPAGSGALSTGQVRTVLLADDNEDAAWSLAQLLELADCKVHVATGGEEALRLAEQLTPQAVVLDIGMPDLTGYEVAKRIRAQPWGRDMLLIAATGWGQESDRQTAAEAGFDGHLVKPIDTDALLELLSEGRSGSV